MVSGVIALMLEVNPSLSYRDIMHILVESADQVDPSDPEWKSNGANKLVNHSYGFGLVDADRAVAMAMTWTPVVPLISYRSPLVGNGLQLPIPDNDPKGRSLGTLVHLLMPCELNTWRLWWW